MALGTWHFSSQNNGYHFSNGMFREWRGAATRPCAGLCSLRSQPSRGANTIHCTLTIKDVQRSNSCCWKFLGVKKATMGNDDHAKGFSSEELLQGIKSSHPRKSDPSEGQPGKQATDTPTVAHQLLWKLPACHQALKCQGKVINMGPPACAHHTGLPQPSLLPAAPEAGLTCDSGRLAVVGHAL